MTSAAASMPDRLGAGPGAGHAPAAATRPQSASAKSGRPYSSRSPSSARLARREPMQFVNVRHAQGAMTGAARPAPAPTGAQRVEAEVAKPRGLGAGARNRGQKNNTPAWTG